MNEVNKAVAYVIASAGFDVWLGNNRGSKYSRSSEHADPDLEP
jgi:lysosomal acid lipase/cholesteryl ester hydrolase